MLLEKVSRFLRSRKKRTRVIDISDDYTNRLCQAIPGWLHRGNLYCFEYCIRNLPNDAPIIEIGSFCGLSTNAITYYMRKHGTKNTLIACDSWIDTSIFLGTHSDGPVSPHSVVTHDQYRNYLKESYLRSIQTFSKGDPPRTAEMFSDEFFAAWRDRKTVNDIMGNALSLGGAVSFCYIDGDHSYQSCKRDFQNCDEFLTAGGLLLFDDSADKGIHEGVRKCAKEVQQCGGYELVIKNPNYLFRKK